MFYLMELKCLQSSYLSLVLFVWVQKKKEKEGEKKRKKLKEKAIQVKTAKEWQAQDDMNIIFAYITATMISFIQMLQTEYTT